MTCEEVKINLHDYVDELLDGSTKKEVEYHIRNCDLCFRDYKKMMAFFEALKQLPSVFNPPKDVIESVRAELLNIRSGSVPTADKKKATSAKKLNKEKERQTKKLEKEKSASKKSKITKKLYNRTLPISSAAGIRKTLLTLTPLFLIAAGYFLYELNKNNSPWKVISYQGSPLIGGTTNHSGEWNEGELLKTDEFAEASIAIPKVGTLVAGPHAVLMLDKGKDGENEITLKKGTISLLNNEDMPALTINATGFNIIDRGGKFDLDVVDESKAVLKVNYAFVEIKYNDNSYMVDENHYCTLIKGKRPSTPLHKEVSDSLKAFIDLFDHGEVNEQIIEKIISLAKERDLLTLLALIPEVPQLQRQIIFQKISNTFPPPENVTRAGIMRLDKIMLYQWWEEIEWQL